MPRSVTCFKGRARVVAVFLLGLATAAPSLAVTFKTKDDALAGAFPGMELARRTVTLTQEQAGRVETLCGEPPASRLVYPYEAVVDGKVVGTAYFDVHKVRTLPETILVVVNPDGSARSIEILAFHEPLEYIAPAKWLAQFSGRALSDGLRPKKDIDGITGATLTARAVARSVRQVLAIHSVIAESGP